MSDPDLRHARIRITLTPPLTMVAQDADAAGISLAALLSADVHRGRYGNAGNVFAAAPGLSLSKDQTMTRDAEILKFSTYARRVPKPDRGACSCRRHIVRVFEAIECGAFETHSRRRCVFRKSRTVISAPAW